MTRYEITKNGVTMDGRWAWVCQAAGLPKTASPDTLASVIRDLARDAQISVPGETPAERKLEYAVKEVERLRCIITALFDHDLVRVGGDSDAQFAVSRAAIEADFWRAISREKSDES